MLLHLPMRIKSASWPYGVAGSDAVPPWGVQAGFGGAIGGQFGKSKFYCGIVKISAFLLRIRRERHFFQRVPILLFHARIFKREKLALSTLIFSK